MCDGRSKAHRRYGGPPMKSSTLLAALAGVLLISCFALPASASSGANTLDQFTWHQRVLLVFADTPQSAQLVSQRNVLEHARDVMSERDLVLVEVVGHSVKGASDSADALRQRYNEKAKDFARC
ncbi:MAG: hypothetical protein CPDRYMAC_4901 [uncultured Paraburkholderia sp.]|nr:MAG: hypothetical protein CPDRYDRY_4873 [uncultured Paraburkholderia sp.]CAH2938720.1 MAG: hypothetical protein CPDRYMAC_4901 [uncultured Paraburkholderia sp.]